MKQEEWVILGIQGQLEREKWEWILGVCLGYIVRLGKTKGNSKYNVPNSQSGGVARKCS